MESVTDLVKNIKPDVYNNKKARRALASIVSTDKALDPWPILDPNSPFDINPTSAAYYTMGNLTTATIKFSSTFGNQVTSVIKFLSSYTYPMVVTIGCPLANIPYFDFVFADVSANLSLTTTYSMPSGPFGVTSWLPIIGTNDAIVVRIGNNPGLIGFPLGQTKPLDWGFGGSGLPFGSEISFYKYTWESPIVVYLNKIYVGRISDIHETNIKDWSAVSIFLAGSINQIGIPFMFPSPAFNSVPWPNFNPDVDIPSKITTNTGNIAFNNSTISTGASNKTFFLHSLVQTGTPSTFPAWFKVTFTGYTSMQIAFFHIFYGLNSGSGFGTQVNVSNTIPTGGPIQIYYTGINGIVNIRMGQSSATYSDNYLVPVIDRLNSAFLSFMNTGMLNKTIWFYQHMPYGPILAWGRTNIGQPIIPFGKLKVKI